MRFRGVNSVNLDAKGRMALPVRFRELLQEVSGGHLVVTIDIRERCLLLYPLQFWEDIQAQLEALPNVDPEARRLQRLLIGHATDLELDGSGRVLLPQLLREYGGLEKKLVLIGQGKKLEIWAEEVWHARREHMLSEAAGSSSGGSGALQSISL